MANYNVLLFFSFVFHENVMLPTVSILLIACCVALLYAL